METVFGWFAQIVQFLGSFIPRLGICCTYERGVKFVGGKKTVPVNPGLFVYWPIMTETFFLPVVRRSVNLSSQKLMTSDNVVLSVSGIVVYEISDATKAICETFEVNNTISDIALTAIADAVASRTLAELRSADLLDAFTRDCRAALRGFGIHVLRCGLSDLAPCRVIALASDSAGMKVGP